MSTLKKTINLLNALPENQIEIIYSLDICGGEIQLLADGLDGIVRLCQYPAGVLDFFVRNVFGQGDAHMLLEYVAQVVG